MLNLRSTDLKCFFLITFHFNITFNRSEYGKAFLNFKSLKPDFHRCQVLAVVINFSEGIGQRAVSCTKEKKNPLILSREDKPVTTKVICTVKSKRTMNLKINA